MELNRYRRLLGAYLKPQGGRVVLLAVLLLSSLTVELLNPLILRAFIDQALGGAPLDNLLWLACCSSSWRSAGRASRWPRRMSRRTSA